ncbi:MAG: hypothetical protein KatS3mg110_1973 [Pirellulaceae bacterium]|nr:MAG: hypothetical protein KatS3mg110_1973 [Pirellulaceae bacterium]
MLRIGLIGCGKISRTHREAMKRQADAAFVAFCDTDFAKAQQAASEDAGAAYSDVDRMLDEQALDGVIICTPPMFRTELIEAAARRGLPILCEKPPANSLEMARRTQEIISQYNALVSVGFLFRYYPLVDRLKALIRDRPVAYVRSRYLGHVVNNPVFEQTKTWYLRKDLSGGPILDQAIHVLDLVRYLFGDVQKVSAQGAFRIRPSDTINTAEDTVTVQFTTCSGVLVSHSHCWGHYRWVDELEVTGAEFSFVLDLNAQRLRGVDGPEEIELNDTTNGFEQEQSAWLEAIRTGNRSLVRSTYEDAVKSLALCLAINRSMESQQAEMVAV